MGARGPKPKPTKLRLLQGGASKRAGNPLEPQMPAPTELPDPPIYLNSLALEEWNRVVEDLFSTGVYANVDQTMLAAYCMAYSRWRWAEADLDKMAENDPTTHAALIKTTNGNAIQNPLVGVANTARREMQRLAGEFGLTPSSRTSIEGGKGGDPDTIGAKYFR